MSLETKLFALVVLFLGSVAVGFCQPDFGGLSGDMTMDDSSSSTDKNQVKQEIAQLFEEALRDNEKLFENIQEAVGDLISRRKALLQRPKNEGFKSMRFRWWWFIYSTKSFQTSEWFSPREVKDNKNPGIRLLPCRLISDINKAIEAAYRKGFHHYGYRGTGYSWHTLSCAKIKVSAQDPSALTSQFKEHEDNVTKVLDEAKAFFQENTGGDKKQVVDKERKDLWKKYVNQHVEGLKAMERLINQYANAAIEFSNKTNRQRFEKAVKRYEETFGYTPHGFISVLPAAYRQIIEAKLSAAYEEGVGDGLEAGITWQRQKTNQSERYTAYWLGRPIMRNCLYRTASATVHGDSIRVAFTVDNGSFSTTEYWYPASPMWEANFSILSFLLDVASSPGCDYGECSPSGSGSSWNDSYSDSGSSSWNDSPSNNGSSTWNDSSSSTWNDSQSSNTSSWNDSNSTDENSWND